MSHELRKRGTGHDWLTARPVAHRGLHDSASGILENTPSAVAAAVEAGYAVEVDLQITADGEAMVHHDATLGRLTEGAGRLDAMTAADLKRVSFKATSDRMMALMDLLDLVAGRAALFLELKSRFDRDLRLPRRVAAALASHSGPVAVMSFDPHMMAAIRGFAPLLPRGIVAERSSGREADGAAKLAGLLHALGSRPDFLAYCVQDLVAPVPLMARHVLRMPLLTWTVRTEDDRRRAARFADQMIFEGFRP
jgi:glycerophosphoryl diester phosphodiesterase